MNHFGTAKHEKTILGHPRLFYMILLYICQKDSFFKKNIADFRYLKNFKRVDPCEIQRDMSITSWPAAGADFSVYYRYILGGGAPQKFLKISSKYPPLVF